jgi:hypothetical protein
LGAPIFDTATAVSDELVLYAYDMLECVLATDMENVEKNLKALGLEYREAFNSAFPRCFFPGYDTAEKDWRASFCKASDGD